MEFSFFNFAKPKKKIGLCLSGGGVKGLAHIGALKVFEENNINFDMVSGTSVGSIIGSAYALGLTSDDILKAALDIGFKDFITSKKDAEKKADNKTKDIEKMAGNEALDLKKIKSMLSLNPAIDSTKIEKILLNLYGDKYFSDTKIPFYAVSVDLKTGREIILDSGRLALACRASSSIPGVFTPTPMEDMLLVDGFVLNNMPADVLKNKGCDYVVSINLKAYAKPGKDSSKYVDVLNTTIDIMAYASLLAGSANTDIMISPKVDDTISFDISDKTMGEVYQLGYDATKEKLPEILSLLRKNKLI